MKARLAKQPTNLPQNLKGTRFATWEAQEIAPTALLQSHICFPDQP